MSYFHLDARRKKCISMSISDTCSLYRSSDYPSKINMTHALSISALFLPSLYFRPSTHFPSPLLSQLSSHLWTTPKETHYCLQHMTMFLIVGTRLSTWQTPRATNQRPSVKPLPTNRGVMPFHRSSQPFILQQCWEWSGAMLTDDAVICHSFFIWRIKIFETVI